MVRLPRRRDPFPILTVGSCALSVSEATHERCPKRVEPSGASSVGEKTRTSTGLCPTRPSTYIDPSHCVPVNTEMASVAGVLSGSSQFSSHLIPPKCGALGCNRVAVFVRRIRQGEDCQEIAHIAGYALPVASCILPVRGIHFGTAVGQQALWATVSALNSHRSDDSGPKVGHWPMFRPATVPKWIPPLPDMGGCVFVRAYLSLRLRITMTRAVTSRVGSARFRTPLSPRTEWQRVHRYYDTVFHHPVEPFDDAGQIWVLEVEDIDAVACEVVAAR